MRKIYLVAYDICDPERLRRVAKKMQGYGDRLQYSVFACPLSPVEKKLMMAAMGELINHNEDRVMVVDLGPQKGKAKEKVEFIGQRVEFVEEGAVII